MLKIIFIWPKICFVLKFKQIVGNRSSEVVLSYVVDYSIL